MVQEPILTKGIVSNEIYIVTSYKQEEGHVVARKKVNVTEQFKHLALELGWQPPPSKAPPLRDEDIDDKIAQIKARR